MGLDPKTIRADLENKLLDGQSVRPQHVNRASQCGSPCLRELYYARAEWQNKAPMSLAGLKRVRAGKRYEEWAKQDLMTAGYIWAEAQKSGFDADLNLSAHIEGYVIDVRDPEQKRQLAEIKSITTLLFPRFNSQADLLEHGFYRRYIFQIVAYMKFENVLTAMLFLVNRDDSDIKPITITYEPELWNEIKEKCEIVNGAVEIKRPPVRIDGRGRKEVCKFCSFKMTCLPDVLNPSRIKLKDDPELLEELREWHTLGPHRARWKTLDDIIKEKCKGKDMVVVGEFLIEGKQTKAGWRREITRLKGVTEDDDNSHS